MAEILWLLSPRLVLAGFAFSLALGGKVSCLLPFGLGQGAFVVLHGGRKGLQYSPDLLYLVLVLFLDVHGGDAEQSGELEEDWTLMCCSSV